jgi:membrane dipeptidase
MPLSDRARALHQDALIIDGLNFFSDGTTDVFRQGNVHAVNLTVAGLLSDYAEVCDQLGVWHARLSDPKCEWFLVRETADFDRARKAGKIGLIMGWQNMRAIDDKLERLAFFHALGTRIMQLTYNERNFIGDGCLEAANSGLSNFGRRVIGEMNRLGIAIDLSHVGERTCLETCEVSAKPVLVTHANAKAVAMAPRNKSDEVIKAVAATGGLIGVSVYGPMCWDGRSTQRPSLADFMRHVDHIAGLAGPERMSFGTDFPAVSDLAKVGSIIEMTLSRYPGAVSKYAQNFGNDVRTRYLADCGSLADLANMTDALLRGGWSEAQVRGLLGENLRAVLARIWGA